jgi:hypothetical protein
MSKSQEHKILSALKNHIYGLHPTFFTEHLHITQYGRAINNLRKWFRCECKSGNRCSSDEHIINKRLPNKTTVFIYKKNPSINSYFKDLNKEAEMPLFV